jgi:hypothetical protein
MSALSVDERAAVFHVGMPKTGTTYMQSLARNNVEALAAGNVLYPSSYPEVGFGHHSICADLMSPSDGKTPALDFYRSLESHQGKLWFSSEGMIEMTAEKIEILKHLYPARPSFAVAYFREPTGFLRSWVQEGIKHGWSSAWDDVYYSSAMRGLARNPGLRRRMDILASAEKVLRAFGPENTVFVAYDNLLESGEDLFLHFVANILGATDLQLSTQNPFRNESMDFTTQEINRLLNQLVQDRGIKPTTEVYQFVIGNIRVLIDRIPELRNLTAFRQALPLRSRTGAAGVREHEMASRFGAQFMNAASDEFIYHNAFARDLEWANLEAFSKAYPSAVRLINIEIVPQCLAYLEAVKQQGKNSSELLSLRLPFGNL